jgi:hypothetical protein
MTDIEEAFSICGYCFRPIDEDEDGLLSGAFLESAEGFAPTELEGSAVEVWRADDHIVAVVPDAESEMAEEGCNLMFLVCRPECGDAIDRFLRLPSPVELRPFSPGRYEPRF